VTWNGLPVGAYVIYAHPIPDESEARIVMNTADCLAAERAATVKIRAEETTDVRLVPPQEIRLTLLVQAPEDVLMPSAGEVQVALKRCAVVSGTIATRVGAPVIVAREAGPGSFVVDALVQGEYLVSVVGLGSVSSLHHVQAQREGLVRLDRRGEVLLDLVFPEGSGSEEIEVRVLTQSFAENGTPLLGFSPEFDEVLTRFPKGSEALRLVGLDPAAQYALELSTGDLYATRYLLPGSMKPRQNGGAASPGVEYFTQLRVAMRKDGR
jgi:hypothetical protein